MVFFSTPDFVTWQSHGLLRTLWGRGCCRTACCRHWPVWIFSFVFCYFKEVPVQKKAWSISSLDLWGSCFFNLSRFLFPLQMISTGLLLSCALWISTFVEKWKHCTFKGTESKTVASGFKVTELVNFLLCFAELDEKDLIECYCLGININKPQKSPSGNIFSFFAKNFKLWSRTWIIIVNWKWIWETWSDWIEDLVGGEQLFGNACPKRKSVLDLWCA